MDVATESIERSANRPGPAAREREELQAAGIDMRGVSGDVVDARASREALERLLRIDFVIYVESGGPVVAEPERGR